MARLHPPIKAALKGAVERTARLVCRRSCLCESAPATSSRIEPE